jgi:hypothetical protein
MGGGGGEKGREGDWGKEERESRSGIREPEGKEEEEDWGKRREVGE